MKRFGFILILLSVLCFSIRVKAQQVPTISPTAYILTSNGEEENNAYSGSAPLDVRFEAHAEHTEGWNSYFEWRFYKADNRTNPYLVRYEENTQYTFLNAGTTLIELHTTFVQGTDTVQYGIEYWSENTPISISVSESKLEFPNAFSPNGDGINDVYKAKEGYQSIVSFHAYIYNRWGQKLYEWTDPAGGWDGTYRGKAVQDGVYYVLVEAKGADGKKYNIKRDVNVLRGFTDTPQNTQ